MGGIIPEIDLSLSLIFSNGQHNITSMLPVWLSRYCVIHLCCHFIKITCSQKEPHLHSTDA